MSALTRVAFAPAGALGAVLRYLVDGAVPDRTEGAFPGGTFLTVRLVEERATVEAFLNVAGMVATCAAGAGLGLALGAL